MKCSPRILDTTWAIISAGLSAAYPGTGKLVPTPCAVGPTRTILPAYLVAGILPLSTS